MSKSERVAVPLVLRIDIRGEKGSWDMLNLFNGTEFSYFIHVFSYFSYSVMEKRLDDSVRTVQDTNAAL